MTEFERWTNEEIAKLEQKKVQIKEQISQLQFNLAFNKITRHDCETCVRRGFSGTDQLIFHDNGHSWPGFAGDPS